MTTNKLWIWRWEQGGYNCCQAPTRRQAIANAETTRRFTVLTIDKASLHVGTQEELNKLDARFAGMFD